MARQQEKQSWAKLLTVKIYYYEIYMDRFNRLRPGKHSH